MNAKELESVVLTELHGKYGLDSLKVQNHIYGCFIVMEDIAESNMNLDGSILSTTDFSIDLEKQFLELGIRFGFLLDTHLEWDQYSLEYKKNWLECFQYLQTSHDMNAVELLEYVLIETIKKETESNDAYFLNAMEHGILSRKWQDKVINLIKNPIVVKESELEEQLDTGLSHANVEKPLHNTVEKHHKYEKNRGLHKTRRQKKVTFQVKKSGTRRASRA